MKNFYIALLTALLLVSAAAVSAATLTNTDGQSYRVQVMVDGQRYGVTLLNGATISLPCDYGCAVRLVETGQTLAVEPNDSVVISYEVLRVK
jgi:hypothetical protein